MTGTPTFLWYLNGADGTVPWQPAHRVTPSLEHLRGVAAEIDRLGYYGVLCTAREPIALVSAMYGVLGGLKEEGV